MDILQLSNEEFAERSRRLYGLALAYADSHDYTEPQAMASFSFRYLQRDLDRYHYEEMDDQQRFELAKKIQKRMNRMQFEHNDYEKAFYD